MREVYVVTSDKKQVVEDLLKKDDVVSRQSIVIRSASALGFDVDGYFIILNADERAMKKAAELIGSLAKKYEKKDAVLKKFDEDEENAASGFGFIMGG
jgi:hypothetical protein